jgi:ornithine cyclodeaminase/alanine dehydrogenase-like protein (mu-crystallin family)
MDDITTAKYVLDNARSRGVGTTLHLRTGPPVWE